MTEKKETMTFNFLLIGTDHFSSTEPVYFFIYCANKKKTIKKQLKLMPYSWMHIEKSKRIFGFDQPTFYALRLYVSWRQFIDCIIRAYYLWQCFLLMSCFGALSTEVNISHRKTRRLIDFAKVYSITILLSPKPSWLV